MGIPELKKIQEFLVDYPIILIQADLQYSFLDIYESVFGTQAPTTDRIHLLLHDNHFDVITKLPGLFNHKGSGRYICEKCFVSYRSKKDHSCENICQKCFSGRCNYTAEKVTCQDLWSKFLWC